MKPYKKKLLKKAEKIRLVLFDVDGVLTDGRLYLDDNGIETKAFHSQDGLGLAMLQRTGVQVGVITGRTSQLVSHRMASLGIKHVYQGQLTKLTAFKQVRDALELSNDEIAFVGDDVIDIAVMKKAGLSIVVPNARPEVKAVADWCTFASGGQGAGRDVCELIMHAQGTWKTQFHYYD